MSHQIKNSAVVSSRNKERPPHPLAAQFAAAGLDRMMVDDYPTPPWAGRAWAEHVVGRAALSYIASRGNDPIRIVWEPAANRGFLARGLKEYCDRLVCSDLFDYSSCYAPSKYPAFPRFNFLDLENIGVSLPAFLPDRPDWIVTNPPFSRAHEFIALGLQVARVGVAMLCRIQITESLGRYREIFAPLHPCRWTWSQFVERVPIREGKCERDQSTMTAYGWLTIWKEPQEPDFILARRFIPPCRAQLEKPDDYR